MTYTIENLWNETSIISISSTDNLATIETPDYFIADINFFNSNSIQIMYIKYADGIGFFNFTIADGSITATQSIKLK